MATNSYDQTYKYTYSKEVDLLDALVNNVEQAASNLDTNAIENLMITFKSQTYSLLRPANQQYFDELSSYVNVLLSNIKKRKALAEQWEKKRQIIESSYNRLQQIKKNITNAKTISELEKAKKQYERWKSESAKIKFGWEYNKKVDLAKSYILEKIGPKDAINELKNLLENAKHSDGFENDSTIKAWISKYPLDCFHEVYKREVNSLTSEAFSLVKEPVPTDIQNNSNTSVGAIPSILLMNPTQSHAVYNLQKIMNKNPQDFHSILQWIYTYRNVPFDGPYKQSISKLIPANYGITLNNRYSIPCFETDNLTSKQIDGLVKDTVINYFGILLCGNSLSSAKKHTISDTYKHSKTSTVVSEICENEKIADELLQSDAVTNSEISTSETGATVKVEVESPVQSENIIDINADSYIEPTNVQNDGATELESDADHKNEIEVQISSILPEIEFDENKFDSFNKSESFSSLSEREEEPTKDSFDNVHKNEDIEPKADIETEIKTKPTKPQNEQVTPSIIDDEDTQLAVENSPHDKSPYSLTTEDIENIESIYTVAQPKVEQISIEQPRIKEEPVKYTFHETIDIDEQN